VALSAIAFKTDSLRIGPMITPLLRRRVQKVARETVTLDYLSNGRLTLGVGLGGDVGLVAVTLSGAGLAGVPSRGVHGRDHPVCCDSPGDPPRPGPLVWLDVLTGDQRQQRDCLILLGVQLQVGHCGKHG
jgi:uncharacterized Zn-finger protein